MKIFYLAAFTIICSAVGCISEAEQRESARNPVQENDSAESIKEAQGEIWVEDNLGGTGGAAADSAEPAVGEVKTEFGSVVGSASKTTDVVNSTSDEASNAVDADSNIVDASNVYGKWRIEACSLYGEPYNQRKGDLLSIASSGLSSIERAGQLLPLELSLKENGNPNQFDIMFATSEDSIAVGGGGARAGLIKLLDNGKLEMLVAGSAAAKRPADFSPAQKKSHIYYLATPVSQN